MFIDGHAETDAPVPPNTQRRATPSTQSITAAASHSTAHGAQSSSVVQQTASTSNQPPTPTTSQPSSAPEPAASTAVTVQPETRHLCMDDMIVLHPSFPGNIHFKGAVRDTIIGHPHLLGRCLISEGALQVKRTGQHFRLYLLMKPVFKIGDWIKIMGKYQAFTVPIRSNR